MKPDIMKVESVSVERLIPYANNARLHSDAQVAQIAGSIREFGFNNPVLVDAENGIIAGHGRVLAARKLGLTDVPCIRLDHLSEMQKRAFIIADNRLTETGGGWDEELLKIELMDIEASGLDPELTGFVGDDLDAILAEQTAEGLTADDEVPSVPVHPVSVLGDAWVMGKHRLVCGDSVEQASLDRLMQGRLADMVFTDPPWNVNYGDVDKVNPQGWKTRSILNDNMSAENWGAFCRGIAASLASSTKPGAMLYCVMSAQEWPVIDASLRNAGFHWSSTLIWVKDALVLSRKDYHTQYEPIWYGWNGASARLVQLEDRKQSDVWNCDRPKVSELHPTTKPIELVLRAVTNSSKQGGLVLDLFGGSGSTLIACEKSGRTCASMELDPQYADVIVERWQNFTGKQAVNESTGLTFNETRTKMLGLENVEPPA